MFFELKDQFKAGLWLCRMVECTIAIILSDCITLYVFNRYTSHNTLIFSFSDREILHLFQVMLNLVMKNKKENCSVKIDTKKGPETEISPELRQTSVAKFKGNENVIYPNK